MTTEKKTKKKRKKKAQSKPKEIRIKQDGTPAKNNAGRPIEYRPEMVQQMLDWFNIEPLIEVERITGYDRDGQPIRQIVQEVNTFPTLGMFAISIGKTQTTLLEWAKHYPEFSKALEQCKTYQEYFLIVTATKGKAPPTFNQFMLKNINGYDDKKTVEHQGNEEKPLAVKAVDVRERIKQLKDVN